MKLATYRSGGAVRVGGVDADAGRLFDLAGAARRAGVPEDPFASMLALIDLQDAGLDLALSLFNRGVGEADLWSDLAHVELLAPLPEPRQMLRLECRLRSSYPPSSRVGAAAAPRRCVPVASRRVRARDGRGAARRAGIGLS